MRFISEIRSNKELAIESIENNFVLFPCLNDDCYYYLVKIEKFSVEEFSHRFVISDTISKSKGSHRLLYGDTMDNSFAVVVDGTPVFERDLRDLERLLKQVKPEQKTTNPTAPAASKQSMWTSKEEQRHPLDSMPVGEAVEDPEAGSFRVKLHDRAHILFKVKHIGDTYMVNKFSVNYNNEERLIGEAPVESAQQVIAIVTSQKPPRPK